MSVPQFLISLLVILIAAKIGAELAERAHLPSVLGELVAGIIIGAGIFGPLSVRLTFLRPIVIHSSNSTLELLGQLGALLLLFEVGLDCDINELLRLGRPSVWLAGAGALFSFVLGFAACRLLAVSLPISLFVGASITATSVGISVRTFQDLRQSGSREAKLVLGAAVADDVIGLIILAAVTSSVTAGFASFYSIAKITFWAILFLVGAIFAGIKVTPAILGFASRMRSRAALSTVALIICLYFAYMATKLGGLSPIIGAFAAGLALSKTEHRLQLQQRLKPIADVFIPIFFVIVGTAMPLSALDPATSAGRNVLLLAIILTIAAVCAKILAGLTVPLRLNRLVVGCGMAPRGEVSLIFAAYGIRTHILDVPHYSVILVVIMLTTFLTPPAIKFFVNRTKERAPEGSQQASAAEPLADNHRLCVPY